MPKKYTQEQFWELYEKLPQELKDVLFAEETGNNIYEICKRNGIEENLEAIVDYVSQVLVGVLPPDDFQKTLEKDLGIDTETAQKVAREIHRFIFYPVKTTLEELYKIETTGVPTPAKPSTVTPSAPAGYHESSESAGNGKTLQAEIEDFAAAGEKKEEEKNNKKDDSYRETIE